MTQLFFYKCIEILLEYFRRKIVIPLMHQWIFGIYLKFLHRFDERILEFC